jgi:hypothetical protein
MKVHFTHSDSVHLEHGLHNSEKVATVQKSSEKMQLRPQNVESIDKLRLIARLRENSK